MTDPNEMPLSAEFFNFKQGRVWAALQKKFTTILEAEKEKFFTIDDDDLKAQHDQRIRAKMAMELASQIRVFVLNSARQKEK